MRRIEKSLRTTVIDDSCKLCKEMLFAKLLEFDTTGLSIFEARKSWFDENQISFGNLVSCATDGAPSMLGKQNGFIAHMKELCPSILAVHCVVHRHHLVAKKISSDRGGLCMVLWNCNTPSPHSILSMTFDINN